MIRQPKINTAYLADKGMLSSATRPFSVICGVGLCMMLSEGYGLKSLDVFHGRITHSVTIPINTVDRYFNPSLPGMKVISSLIRGVPSDEYLNISFHFS